LLFYFFCTFCGKCALMLASIRTCRRLDIERPVVSNFHPPHQTSGNMKIGRTHGRTYCRVWCIECTRNERDTSTLCKPFAFQFNSDQLSKQAQVKEVPTRQQEKKPSANSVHVRVSKARGKAQPLQLPTSRMTMVLNNRRLETRAPAGVPSRTGPFM
jgi:hypothetical protein